MRISLTKKGMALGVAILFIATVLTPMILITRANPDPDGLIWSDGFEDYAVGSFPSTWIPDGNAPGSGNYVTDVESYSGDKALRLEGVFGGCWAALAHRYFGTAYEIGKSLLIDYSVKIGPHGDGCHGCGNLVLHEYPSWTAHGRTLIEFDRYSDRILGAIGTIGTYQYGVWYQIRVKYSWVSDSSVEVHYWIDGEDKGVATITPKPYESDFSYLTLTSGDGTTWYDDVSIEILDYFSNLLINPGFEDGLTGWSNTQDYCIWTITSDSHSGSYAAKGVELYRWNLGRLYQDFTGRLIPGTEYKIGGWMKMENVVGGGSPGFGLEYVDSNGWTPADGHVMALMFPYQGSSDWTYFESDWFTLPSMPNDCEMLWFLFDFGDSKGTAYWDDVFLIGKLAPVEPVEKKALLIAGWDYPDKSPDIRNNVKAMEVFLKWGFNYEVEICDNPSWTELDSYITNLKGETHDSDKKFIYYSGHGSEVNITDGINEGLTLKPGQDIYYDYDLSSKLDDMNNLGAIFESCHSGGLCNTTDDTEDYHPPWSNGLNGIAGDSKVIGMASNSTGTAISYWHHGIFTRNFIAAYTIYRHIAQILIPSSNIWENLRVSMEEALILARDYTERDFYKFIYGQSHPQIYDSYPTENDSSEQFYLSDEPMGSLLSFLGLCPVQIHAYDSFGNHVGLNDSGDVDYEIPGVLYCGPGDDELLVVFNPEDNNYIQIVAEAYDNGYFTLECQDYDKENQTTLTILYQNIPIIEGSVASVTVEDGVFGDMEIDDDGDNITDRTIAPYVLPTTGFVPKARFTYSPEKPFVDQIIMFNASSSYDVDGEIVNYSWDFGDGTNGDGEIVTHSYLLPGVYTVTLTVTDDDGLTDFLTYKIVVNELSIYDVNIDGKVNFLDALLTWVHRTTDEYDYNPAYDVNDDGVVDAQDAMLTWNFRDQGG